MGIIAATVQQNSNQNQHYAVSFHLTFQFNWLNGTSEAVDHLCRK